MRVVPTYILTLAQKQSHERLRWSPYKVPGLLLNIHAKIAHPAPSEYFLQPAQDGLCHLHPVMSWKSQLCLQH